MGLGNGIHRRAKRLQGVDYHWQVLCSVSLHRSYDTTYYLRNVGQIKNAVWGWNLGDLWGLKENTFYPRLKMAQLSLNWETVAVGKGVAKTVKYWYLIPSLDNWDTGLVKVYLRSQMGSLKTENCLYKIMEGLSSSIYTEQSAGKYQ